ncbi:MAG: hypothetical protein IKJ59_06640, partial [Clostridia bacterium]|nr:hypothetical protein [Lachnospiraceae bacterium]MBR3918396.1 hypothetical protein [Clostridia bacterium]
IAQIHNYVSDVKYSAEVKHRFMTVGEWFDRHRAMAEAEALEKGLAEGREKGLAEGREEGREEGRAEMTQEMVKRMLKKKNPFSYEEIAELTSLSVAEIEAIASQLD